MSDEYQVPPNVPPAPAAPPPAGGAAPSDTGKLLAAFGYLVGIVALIAILIEPYKDEPFVKHHAVQALALWVASIAIGVIAAIPYIGWVIAPLGGIAIFVFAVMGAIKAFGGEMWEMPVVYNLVKQYI